MISDEDLAEWFGRVLKGQMLNLEQQYQLILTTMKHREQLKPDCVNGCIFKLARKIAEEGK